MRIGAAKILLGCTWDLGSYCFTKQTQEWDSDGWLLRVAFLLLQTSDLSVHCPSWTPLGTMPWSSAWQGEALFSLAWLLWAFFGMSIYREEWSPVATVHLPSLVSGPPPAGPRLSCPHVLSVDLATVHEPCLPHRSVRTLWILRVCSFRTLLRPIFSLQRISWTIGKG